MATVEHAKISGRVVGARRTLFLLLSLAFFVIGTSCGRRPGAAREPLLVVVPQLESRSDSAPSVGLAAWIGLSARAMFGPRLRVAAPPEVVEALGVDSLASSQFVRRALRRVEPDLVVFCQVRSPDSMTWRLESGEQLLASGAGEHARLDELFGALAKRVAGTARPPDDLQVPGDAALGRAGQLLLGKKPSDLPELSPADSAVVGFCGFARTLHFLDRALEGRARGEDVTEPLYETGEVLRTLWHDTSSAEWQLWRGAYFVVAQRWSQAERWLGRAWRQNPADGRVAYWLSHLHPSRLKGLGLDGPEDALKRAIGLNPLLFSARLYLAELYFGNRRFKEEERALKSLLAINPAHEEALMRLGRLYMVENDLPRVLATFKKVVDLDPSNADAYYNLGIVYFSTGDLDDAERLFKRAVVLNDHPEAHLYLGFLYEKLGQPDSAIAEYRKRIRLRKGPDDQYANEARKRLWELLHTSGAGAREPTE